MGSQDVNARAYVEDGVLHTLGKTGVERSERILSLVICLPCTPWSRRQPLTSNRWGLGRSRQGGAEICLPDASGAEENLDQVRSYLGRQIKRCRF